MNHVYKTVNRYYQDFESYKGVITWKSVWVWFFLLAIGCMCYSFLWYMEQVDIPFIELTQKKGLLFVLGFEVIAISCWLRLQNLKENVVKKRHQERFKTDTQNLTSLKAIWFEKTIGIENTKYLELAEEIDRFISLKEKHKSGLSLSAKQVRELLFSADSKNRVLAMFMGMCAVIMALCIADGANINTLFKLLSAEPLQELFFYVLLVSILLMVGYLVFRYFCLLVFFWIESFISKADGLKSTSKRWVSIFINQLLLLHNIEKAKIRVNGV